MVGRILTLLRQRGALTAPVLFRVKRRRGTTGRPGARRKPQDYAVEKPGDLVQLDTMDLRLFVLPPRSPKLNGQVERANRTPTEEFYEVTAFSLPIADLNRELQAWERTYNTIRPHHALGYLTPQEFLAQASSQRKELECH